MQTAEKIILGIVLTLAIMGYVGPARAAIYIEEKERKERGELPQRTDLYGWWQYHRPGADGHRLGYA